MTDQLRDALSRVADRSGPVSVDPHLWERASRTRRRRQGLAAAAAALVVAALLGGILAATGVLRTAPRPVDRPDRHDPIKIEGITGDGGLRLEKDLALGRASVAIANDTGAFVVTAADGVAHRIALPGFDAPQYHVPEILALSPDGTKLIYAWHGPLVEVGPDGKAQPRAGWIESGARLLDLSTGAVDTYPSPTPEPENPGLTTQLGRTNWNFRWSPDSRLVAFAEAAGSPGRPNEAWCGQVLDTTKKVTWTRHGPQLNPRPVPELRGKLAAPAVNHAGRVVWVRTPDFRGEPQYREQTLMIETNGAARPQPLPHDVAWGNGRFSPDGRTLLVASAGLADRVLVAHPGRDDTVRGLDLTGDLPSQQVRIELLGWVGTDQVLAAVHQATGVSTWKTDADLALLTLDLDARTVDVALVGRVDAHDTDSATFSFAADLLAVDLPAKGFR